MCQIWHVLRMCQIWHANKHKHIRLNRDALPEPSQTLQPFPVVEEKTKNKKNTPTTTWLSNECNPTQWVQCSIGNAI